MAHIPVAANEIVAHQSVMIPATAIFQVLLDLINRASSRVPVVKYGFGLVGLAACGALIVGILGTSRAAIIIISLTFLGAILLFLFARLSGSRTRTIHYAGVSLVWVTVIFFSSFMLLTICAFTLAKPDPWAEFLGVSVSRRSAPPNGIETEHSKAVEHLKETEICNDRIHKMWIQLDNSAYAFGDVERTADEVESCNSYEAEAARGALAFYKGDYFDAVKHFEKAREMRPDYNPVKRNLADSYLEVGRYDEAVNLYKEISLKDELWSYKVARIDFYNRKYDEALAEIHNVKSDMLEDGNLLGRPRILEAAILIEKSKIASGGAKNKYISEAFANFKDGFRLDPEAWKKVLKITLKTKYEGFKQEVSSLEPYLDKWMQKSCASEYVKC